MRDLLERRILFFGGKGGVGKTTCAAAAALGASCEGKRVLLVSTDPAHSTSDIFGLEIGPVEREILPRLDALEIDPEEAARRYVDEAKTRLSQLFSPAVVRAAARQMEVAATMPGVADAAVFDRVAQIVVDASRRFDLVVFDTAPTGHALRMLRTPELMAGWIDALARRRSDAREAEAASRRPRGAGAEAGEDHVLSMLQARAARLAAVRNALARPEEVAFVLVLIPERLPIEETARAAHVLDEAGIAIGAVVVNRTVPPDADGRYVEARRVQERAYLEEISRRFSAWPRILVPQFESDVHGVEALARVGTHLLAQPARRG